MCDPIDLKYSDDGQDQETIGGIVSPSGGQIEQMNRTFKESPPASGFVPTISSRD